MIGRQRFNEFLRMMIVHIPLGLVIGLAIVTIHELYEILFEVYLHYIHVNHIFTVIFPVIAITSSFFIVTYFSGATKTGGGSHRLLEVYHFEGGKMSLKNTIFEPLASAITIGFGGSAGFEGPSLLLGGGLGSLFGQKIKLTTDELSTILICGAAAGVSAIFKAPLTGIMFALEIPYQKDIYREAFIPATLSSASSYIVADTLMKGERIFPLLETVEISSALSLHSIVIGLLAGLVSIIFVLLKEKANNTIDTMKISPIYIALIGGIAVGILTYFYPETAGTGYETLREILNGELHQPINWFLAIICVKMITTILTLSTGGSGGVFVPALFIGALLGQIYNLSVPNNGGALIVVTAMAAMISASNKTLLTSVALVAETTGPASMAYTLLAAVTSYFVSGNISFYGHVQPEKELLEEEEALHTIFHHFEKKHSELLHNTKINDLIEYKFPVLDSNLEIKDAIKTVTGYPQSVYPVVSKQVLLGSTTLEDLIFLYENGESKIMISNYHPLVVEMDSKIQPLIESLEEGKFDCIFVVQDYKSMIYKGFISEKDILTKLLELFQEYDL